MIRGLFHTSGLPWVKDDPFPANAALSNSELYRIVVAHFLRTGQADTKEEFDDEVRRTITLQMADEVIAFSRLRPGCRAWRHGTKMVCDCGKTWPVDKPGPPCGVAR